MSDTSGTMAADGYYAHHSDPQHRAAQRGLDLIRAAAAGVSLPSDGTALIADLGTAEGANSIEPIDAALAELSRRGATALLVVHSDLASGDWTTFFTTVDAGDKTSSDNSFHVASGRSFYGCLVPQDSLALA